MAVDGVALTAPPGEITGLIGPNGAGKSTVFNAVSGFAPVPAGRVVIAGVDAHRPAAHAARRRSGSAARSRASGWPVAVGHATTCCWRGTATPATGSRTRSSPRRRARRWSALLRDALEVVAALGFTRYRDTPLGSLSHGQQRIVEVACALATRPKVLLLDEPSAGLSPAGHGGAGRPPRRPVRRLGQTILLIEHHLPLVRATCTR